MFEMKTKEHLLYFMNSGMMKLSISDNKFIQNLNYLVANKNPITTNQVLLLDKLIDKYKRQFCKQKYDVEMIKALPWTNTIKESIPEFTEAHISIINGMIHFRAPFNKKFVTQFKIVNDEIFKWNSEFKRFESTFSSYGLKILVDTANKYYPKVNYCGVTQDLLNKLSQYKNIKIWQPTLTIVNGNLFIAGMNQHLYLATKDIELKLDIETVKILGDYGIGLDDDLKLDKSLVLANSFLYETNFNDINEWPNIRKIQRDWFNN